MTNGIRLGAALAASLLLALAVYALLPEDGAPAPPAVPGPRPPASPPPPPATAPATTATPEPAAADPPPAPIPAPAPEEAPRRPSVEERLKERPDILDFQAPPIGTVLEDLARRLGLKVEFASDLLFQTCMATRFGPVTFRTVPLRDILDMAVKNVASPVEGKVVAWKVEKDLLVIHLADPSPPPPETPEEAAKRLEAAKALRARLAEERISLELRGETVMEALVLVGRTHKVPFRPDPAIRERLDVLRVHAALKGATLGEVFDEILRVDPDLAWEVQGHRVVIRKR